MVRIRTKRHDDGRVELIRVLTAEDSWSAEDPLAYEASIVWLVDIESLPFVRESMARGVKSRTAKLRASGMGQMVGYAKLTDDAPVDPQTHGFTRRFFYLKQKDLSGGRIPKTAVDPRSILPGVPGRKLRPE